VFKLENVLCMEIIFFYPKSVQVLSYAGFKLQRGLYRRKNYFFQNRSSSAGV